MEDVKGRRTHRNPLTRALSDERPDGGPFLVATGERRKREPADTLCYDNYGTGAAGEEAQYGTALCYRAKGE